MNKPIYVYDSRTQFEEPIFVAYDKAHVEKFVRSIYGEIPSFIFESYRRLHKYSSCDESYLGRSSKGKK